MHPALTFCLAALAADLRPIEVSVPTRDRPVSYAREVAPVLEARCVACHNAASLQGKLSLEGRPAMLKGGKRGPSLVPGRADQSPLFRMGGHRAEPVMPPIDKPDYAPFTPAELGLLQLWIDAGAPDDSTEAVAPAASIRLSPLPAALRSIVALDLSPDGKIVAAGRGDKVAVFEVGSGRVLAELGGHRDLIQSVRFGPDGKTLAAGGYEVATVWDVPSDPAAAWPASRAFGPHAFRVLAVDFSPDGKLLATGGGDPARTGEVKVWTLADGRLVRAIDGLHTDTVCGLRFSPDGTRLATASADKLVKVVEVETGREVKSFEGHTGHALAVDWSGDGKQVVSGGADNALKVWEVESGDLLRTMLGANKPITALRWVPNRPLVLGSSGDGSARFWNPTGAGNVVRTFAGSIDYLFGVAASRDGKVVAAGGAEGTLSLWNGDDGKLLRKIEPAPR